VASPEIVSRKRGPSVKHSLTAEFPYQQCLCQSRELSCRTRWHGKAEVATPPGDVGFVGGRWGVGTVQSSFVTYFTFVARFVKRRMLPGLTFGGLCRPAAIGDRFFVGTTCICAASCQQALDPDAATQRLELPVHHHRHCSRHLLATPWAE
jgi:hypothetical protein